MTATANLTFHFPPLPEPPPGFGPVTVCVETPRASRDSQRVKEPAAGDRVHGSDLHYKTLCKVEAVILDAVKVVAECTSDTPDDDGGDVCMVSRWQPGDDEWSAWEAN